MGVASTGLVSVTAALLLTACGRPVVVDTAPEAPPYDGPLYVEITASPDDEDADRSGAAGRTGGLREARREADRVLYTYGVDRRVSRP